MEKNKKKLIFLVLILISLVGLYIYNNSDIVTLKSDEFKYEYGDVIIFDKNDILKTDNPKIHTSLIIDQSNIDLEENKNYPKVGKYSVNVDYKEFFINKSKEFSVFVSDTTKPNFIKFPKAIKIMANEDDYDLLSYFVVEDLSEFELKIDTSSVNFEKEGQYDAKAIASDIHGNESIHDFLILIEEEVEESPVIEDDELEGAKPDTAPEEKPVTSEEKPVTPEEKPVAPPAKDPVKPDEPESEIIPTIINGILIVNKKHPLPASYSPGEDPTAIAQLRIMIKDMQNLGYDISNSYSGFRTYSYQKSLYERYVNMDGKAAADTYSARPGHSEHQTGLTYDLKHSDGTLVEKASEAKWISENASDYGFIVRYKAGKEHITGYQAEPWHLRYIGNEATAIYNSGSTLEEYLGVEGGDYYNN